MLVCEFPDDFDEPFMHLDSEFCYRGNNGGLSSFPNSSFVAKIMKLEGGTSDILGDLIGLIDPVTYRKGKSPVNALLH
jgi:hypothetical protein